MPVSFSPFRSQLKCPTFKENFPDSWWWQPPHPHSIRSPCLTSLCLSLSDFVDLFICLLSDSSLLHSRAIVSCSPLFLAYSHKNILTIQSIHSNTLSLHCSPVQTAFSPAYLFFSNLQLKPLHHYMNTVRKEKKFTLPGLWFIIHFESEVASIRIKD
jgi:hypothetical protein